MHSIKKIETDLDLVCLVVPFLMFMKKKMVWFGVFTISLISCAICSHFRNSNRFGISVPRPWIRIYMYFVNKIPLRIPNCSSPLFSRWGSLCDGFPSDLLRATSPWCGAGTGWSSWPPPPTPTARTSSTAAPRSVPPPYSKCRYNPCSSYFIRFLWVGFRNLVKVWNKYKISFHIWSKLLSPECLAADHLLCLIVSSQDVSQCCWTMTFKGTEKNQNLGHLHYGVGQWNFGWLSRISLWMVS